VARVRKETQSHSAAYTFDELWNSVPHLLTPDKTWKVTASHTGEVRKGSTATAFGGLTFEGWTTGVTQQKGMWFQVEFPRIINLAEVQFKSPPISRGWREGSPPPIPTYPREYDVEISNDGKQWTKIVSNAAGTGDFTVIRSAPVQTKYLRMTLLKTESVVHGEKRGLPFDYEVVWNIREMKIFVLEDKPL
jgi:hypothetical protein